jgi:hypothetical protein
MPIPDHPNSGKSNAGGAMDDFISKIVGQALNC